MVSHDRRADQGSQPCLPRILTKYPGRFRNRPDTQVDERREVAHAMAEPDPMPSITLEAAIWRREGMFVPAIACKLKSGDEYWYNAIKMPLTPLKLAIKAAQTAQLDLMKAA